MGDPAFLRLGETAHYTDHKSEDEQQVQVDGLPQMRYAELVERVVCFSSEGQP